MRVIAGIAKGHRLVAPTSPRVRPALDKVKAAIFNILFDVTDARVLDLFAGAGTIGIEALSRGAREAIFVEEWDRAVASIRKNLSHCKLEGRVRIMACSVRAGIARLSRRGEAFDLIFVDPPYLKNLVNPTLAALSASPLVSAATLLVVEHHPKEPIGAVEGLSLTETRKYGQTCVSFLRRAR